MSAAPALAPMFDEMALLGVGYMGGSLALAARAAGVVGRIVGHDSHAPSIELALRNHVIDRVAATPAEAVANADLVVLAAPVSALAGLAAALAPGLDPAAVILDIGSVKKPIAEAVKKVVGEAGFVPCHPLAGTEKSGVGAALASTYRDRPCLLCPLPGTTVRARERAAAFWRAVGAQPVTCSLDEHDGLVAALSHLPHAVAFALARALAADAETVTRLLPTGTLTTSLRDTTRVAASSPRVWRDIFLANHEHVLPLLDRFATELAAIRGAIAAGDGDRLEALLAEGKDSRARLFPESVGS